MAGKPIKMTVSLRSLFAVNNSAQARWGSPSSHPVAKATVELEGTGLSATTGTFGDAQLDVSSIPSGDYVIALTPDAGNLLRSTSAPLNTSDGNKTDKPGTCRYRPLRIQVSLKVQDGTVKIQPVGPCDGATHGAAFFQLPATLLVDWKPDWVACRYQSARPAKTPPTFVLLHRTDGPTPGSALDEFIPKVKSSHYLVDVDGHVIKLVHEDLVASHAGTSWWCGQKSLGPISVGIEIVNKSGSFTQQQYDAIIRTIQDLQRTYPGITRHGILAHGDVRVRSITGLIDLTLVERSGCPGIHFDWKQLEDAGLCSKADASLFKESQLNGEYGGYFKDNPTARLPLFATDAKLLRKDKTSYGVVAGVQADLSSLGYSVNASNGVTSTGEYDGATQAAVDRFRRRYMPGVVPTNEHLNPIFDRNTAIALKRVLLDRQR
jgi:N-acetyl-anhydromuramyl-L-alanine amidase AmpD